MAKQTQIDGVIDDSSSIAAEMLKALTEEEICPHCKMPAQIVHSEDRSKVQQDWLFDCCELWLGDGVADASWIAPWARLRAAYGALTHSEALGKKSGLNFFKAQSVELAGFAGFEFYPIMLGLEAPEFAPLSEIGWLYLSENADAQIVADFMERRRLRSLGLDSLLDRVQLAPSILPGSTARSFSRAAPRLGVSALLNRWTPGFGHPESLLNSQDPVRLFKSYLPSLVKLWALINAHFEARFGGVYEKGAPPLILPLRLKAGGWRLALNTDDGATLHIGIPTSSATINPKNPPPAASLEGQLGAFRNATQTALGPRFIVEQPMIGALFFIRSLHCELEGTASAESALSWARTICSDASEFEPLLKAVEVALASGSPDWEWDFSVACMIANAVCITPQRLLQFDWIASFRKGKGDNNEARDSGYIDPNGGLLRLIELFRHVEEFCMASVQLMTLDLANRHEIHSGEFLPDEQDRIKLSLAALAASNQIERTVERAYESERTRSRHKDHVNVVLKAKGAGLSDQAKAAALVSFRLRRLKEAVDRCEPVERYDLEWWLQVAQGDSGFLQANPGFFEGRKGAGVVQDLIARIEPTVEWRAVLSSNADLSRPRSVSAAS